MRTVGLIACGKSKLDRPAPARDLYTGQLFRLARAYVEANCDEWAILSAKYLLLMPWEVIEPYDRRVPTNKHDLLWWRRNLNYKIIVRYCAEGFVRTPGAVEWDPSLVQTRFVVLAGLDYRAALAPDRDWGNRIPHEAPLAGMGIGEQLGWLSRALKGKMSADAGTSSEGATDRDDSTETEGVDERGPRPSEPGLASRSRRRRSRVVVLPTDELGADDSSSGAA